MLAIGMTSIRGTVAAGAALLILAPLLAACDATNLYLGHRTVVGVNAAVNQDQTTGHVIIGYDRKFGAIVPVSAPPTANKNVTPNTDAREAMSVLSCSELEIDGIFLTGFKEYLATGAAATGFAQAIKTKEQRAAMKEIFDCYDDEVAKNADTAGSTPAPQP
ncbi:MAG: hypothetical protein IPK59_11200 [Rhodospirillaceae bacterium]|nr:hypothetical protein [Rhodospirillaceae bacterium]